MAQRLASPRLVLLSNPKGGCNARAGLTKIDAVARTAGITHLVASTEAEIEAALTGVARESVDMLAINGGDGTVDMVIGLLRTRKIFTTEPILMLLRGGTTNMIHRDAGPAGRPAAAFRKLVRRHRDSAFPVILRCPLKVQPASLDGPLYGFFLATGAIPRAILIARGPPGSAPVGRLGEVWALVSVLARLFLRRNLDNDDVLRPEPLTIETGGGRSTEPLVFYTLTTLNRLIFGLAGLKGASGVATLAMPPSRRPRRGRTDTVQFETRSPWMLDGELYPAGIVDVAVDAPLRFWTGKAR